MASWSGQPLIVRLLIRQFRADPKATDRFGFTPTHPNVLTDRDTQRTFKTAVSRMHLQQMAVGEEESKK